MLGVRGQSEPLPDHRGFEGYRERIRSGKAETGSLPFWTEEQKR